MYEFLYQGYFEKVGELFANGKIIAANNSNSMKDKNGVAKQSG
ncbi:hypothetical protein [Zunongwangia pacifica]|nr:hypothetical protein [Zunongwangia pacifica]